MGLRERDSGVHQITKEAADIPIPGSEGPVFIDPHIIIDRAISEQLARGFN